MTTGADLEGIVLFAHGSRDPLWHRPMLAVAQHITELEPSAIVRCAFLELTSPDLARCANELVTLGVKVLTIVPMFLGVGKHAREDLPLLVKDLQSQHPSLKVRLQPSIGENQHLIHQLALIALSRV